MHKIACIGVTVADVTAGVLEEYPEKGRLVKVGNISIFAGGNAANTAMALSVLGLKASLTAKVGDDWIGNIVVDILKDKGVDVQGVMRDPLHETGCSVVLNSADGERSFITNLGANRVLYETDINLRDINECQLLHVGGALLLESFDGLPMANILRKAKEMGKNTCLDTSWDEQNLCDALVGPCFEYTDLFLPSIVEAEKLTGKSDPKEMAGVFLDAGVKVVSIKMGDKGSLTYTRDKQITVPALPVKVISTNGAGDSYAAGFIAGWVNGLPLKETAYLAAACGAMSTLTCEPTGKISKYNEMIKIMNDSIKEGEHK